MLLPTKIGISTHSAVRYWCSKRSTASVDIPRNRVNHRNASSPYALPRKWQTAAANVRRMVAIRAHVTGEMPAPTAKIR